MLNWRLITKDIRMGKRPLIGLVLLMLLVACSPERSALNNGPLLVQEVTLAPTTPAPTRALSATPSPIVIAISTAELTTLISTPSATTKSNFVVVTPTLPPSQAHTHTPSTTSSWTPTITARPATATISVTYTARAPGEAPGGVVPTPTEIKANPQAQACTTPPFH